GPDDRHAGDVVGPAAAAGGQHLAERPVGDDPGVVVHPAVALGLADHRDHPVRLEYTGVDQPGQAGRVGHVPERDLAHLDRLGHQLSSWSGSGRQVPACAMPPGYAPAAAVAVVTTVPASPAAMRSSEVMIARSPPRSTNRHAASTFGPIDPLAKCPAAAYPRNSATVTAPSGRACG